MHLVFLWEINESSYHTYQSELLMARYSYEPCGLMIGKVIFSSCRRLRFMAESVWSFVLAIHRQTWLRSPQSANQSSRHLTMPPTTAVIAAARQLWDYHRLREPLAPAEGILVFGSNDNRVAEYAADLYHRGLAPWLLFSGGRGRMTEQWEESEAVSFARRARDCGVPSDAIFCETEAVHTGENIAFSRRLLDAMALSPQHVLVLQKPYMERRTRAALEVQWTELSFRMSSPPIEFSDYPNETISLDDLIHALVGDFYRVIDYPSKGLASEQSIPQEVLGAYHLLLEAGYTKQLPPSAL